MKFGTINQEGHKLEGLRNATSGGCIPCIQRNGFENKKAFSLFTVSITARHWACCFFCDHLKLRGNTAI